MEPEDQQGPFSGVCRRVSSATASRAPTKDSRCSGKATRSRSASRLPSQAQQPWSPPALRRISRRFGLILDALAVLRLHHQRLSALQR